MRKKNRGDIFLNILAHICKLTVCQCQGLARIFDAVNVQRYAVNVIWQASDYILSYLRAYGGFRFVITFAPGRWFMSFA